ncbi:thioesterase II family protein [Streptomyces griseus]|uniref:thioesterase II family protein n=1 Tax=Streptomyces griseus TaxID=1911 RepID=UPI0006924D8A|nr:alpha/beta fold hydrolase [Streptomyces griseus]
MSKAGACLWEVRKATPGTARETLLVLPHAGGSAQNYAAWADWFPDDLRILAAQYPGRASRAREPAQADLHRIVDELLDALDGHQGPLHVFGHSMGSYVGFELCWRRQLAGRPPAVLFASGAVPPHRLQPYPAPGVEISDEHLMELMDTCNGIPDAILDSPDLMGLALETLRADLELVNNYSYGEPGRRLRIPIVAFGGDRDALVPGAEIDHWHELSAAKCASHLIPGEHFYYHGDMATFAATVSTYLASINGERKE